MLRRDTFFLVLPLFSVACTNNTSTEASCLKPLPVTLGEVVQYDFTRNNTITRLDFTVIQLDKEKTTYQVSDGTTSFEYSRYRECYRNLSLPLTPYQDQINSVVVGGLWTDSEATKKGEIVDVPAGPSTPNPEKLCEVVEETVLSQAMLIRRCAYTSAELVASWDNIAFTIEQLDDDELLHSIKFPFIGVIRQKLTDLKTGEIREVQLTQWNGL
jgi:hypothetical protein